MPRRAAKKNDLPAEVFTVDEFCETHRISRSSFFKLIDTGRAPDHWMIGKEYRITKEAAARWRAARDAEAQEQGDHGQ